MLFNSNGLAIWYGFPDITTHIVVNNGRSTVITTFMEKLGHSAANAGCPNGLIQKKKKIVPFCGVLSFAF